MVLFSFIENRRDQREHPVYCIIQNFVFVVRRSDNIFPSSSVDV